MKTKLFFSVALAAMVNLVSIAQTTTCDDFSDPLWEAIEEGDIAGYTQDGTYPIQTTDDWHSFSSGQGYWTGELIFNFSGTEQEAVFTLLDYCDWSDVSIIINGTTTVALTGSFPMDIDGFTIDKTIIPSDDGSRAEVSVSGEISTISIDGCETIVESLCVTEEEGEIDNTSIAESQTFVLEVYPNPANNQTRITSPNVIRNVNLYSISGGLIRSVYVQEKNIQLDLTELEKGMYLIYVTTVDGLTGVQKLIKE